MVLLLSASVVSPLTAAHSAAHSCLTWSVTSSLFARASTQPSTQNASPPDPPPEQRASPTQSAYSAQQFVPMHCWHGSPEFNKTTHSTGTAASKASTGSSTDSAMVAIEGTVTRGASKPCTTTSAHASSLSPTSAAPSTIASTSRASSSESMRSALRRISSRTLSCGKTLTRRDSSSSSSTGQSVNAWNVPPRVHSASTAARVAH